MPSREALIGLLADGELHSGAEMARRLGCSRTAVWKQLHRLPELGLEIVAETGRGYRLPGPLELLEPGRLCRELDDDTQARIASLSVEAITDSTSSRLRAAAAPDSGRCQVALAEFQTGGRGRRGRRWFSPFGSGICLSVSTVFARRPPGLPALGLALGVAVQRALDRLGIAGLQLKWPNDVLLGDDKLAGLLVEVDGEADGPLRVIAGLGLNLRVPAAVCEQVLADGALRPVGLDNYAGADVSRNRLAAAMVSELVATLAEFAARGFAPYLAAWNELDYLRERRVQVSAGAGKQEGIARGIDLDGNLLLATEEGIRPVVAGEVSVRPR